jgi:hypothetical protein
VGVAIASAVTAMIGVSNVRMLSFMTIPDSSLNLFLTLG